MMAYSTIQIIICTFTLCLLHSMQCIPTDSTGLTNTSMPDDDTVTPADSIDFMSTTLPFEITTPKLNDSDDLILLLKNLRGRCGSEYTLINVLVERTNAQRQLLLKECTVIYKQDLYRKLKHRFMGDTQRAVVALLTPQETFYAKQLHDAVDGMGTDEKSISEVLGSMSSSEILRVTEIYKREYNSSLKDDLIDDTSGIYQDILVALCSAKRSEDTEIDREAAVVDARELCDASKLKNNETTIKTFIKVLTTRSLPQLKVVFDEYDKVSPRSIIQTILDLYLNEVQYVFLLIVKTVVQPKSHFYAAQLKESLDATFFVDDVQLTRIIVGRAEIDLHDIEETFRHMYGVKLADRVLQRTGVGAYSHLLLSILDK